MGQAVASGAAGMAGRRAQMASRLSAPAPLATSIRKPPAMATFFQKWIAWAASPRLPWNSAAEASEKAAIASAIQRVNAPPRMARPPPSSSAITSGSRPPGTPMASMYCWVAA